MYSAPRGSGPRLPFMPPTACERHRVDVRIGSGGVGDVYRAIATRLNGRVALKVSAGRTARLAKPPA